MRSRDLVPQSCSISSSVSFPLASLARLLPTSPTAHHQPCSYIWVEKFLNLRAPNLQPVCLSNRVEGIARAEERER